MKNSIILSIILLGSFLSIQQFKKRAIGLLVPLEHRAMDEIVRGFKKGSAGYDVDIQNGQGDTTIQWAIIEKFAHYDAVAAIGTDASLLTLNRIGKVIAVDVTDQVKQSASCTGVLESPIEPSYRFIRTALPELQKVAMIYSCSDKNYQMVKTFTAMACNDGLSVQPIMIQSLADLYLLSGAIEKDVQAIFIAKDHLVASGAPILAKFAKEHNIPFISSDEGTVLAGSCAAIGNREYDIGVQAGKIAAEILQGKTAEEIPMEPIVPMTIFLDEKRCQEQGLSCEAVYKAAKHLGTSIQKGER